MNRCVCVLKLSASKFCLHLQETVTFEEGAEQVVNVSDIQRVVEENVISVLARATGEIRATAVDGCSASFTGNATVPSGTALCDVAVNADSIQLEADTLAEAGARPQCRAGSTATYIIP